jgi:hypothetical protein
MRFCFLLVAEWQLTHPCWVCVHCHFCQWVCTSGAGIRRMNAAAGSATRARTECCIEPRGFVVAMAATWGACTTPTLHPHLAATKLKGMPGAHSPMRVVHLCTANNLSNQLQPANGAACGRLPKKHRSACQQLDVRQARPLTTEPATSARLACSDCISQTSASLSPSRAGRWHAGPGTSRSVAQSIPARQRNTGLRPRGRRDYALMAATLSSVAEAGAAHAGACGGKSCAPAK